MKTKFAVFDIDGTLIRWQLYHAVADELASRGHIQPEDYQAMRDARMAWKKRAGSTFQDYEMHVIKVYENAVKQLPKNELAAAIDTVFHEYKDQVYTYTRDLIKQLHEQDYVLLAISGSPSMMVAKLADYYGFSDFIGSDYQYRGQEFVKRINIGARDKDKSLRTLVARHGLDFVGSIGVGDSQSDIAMLKLVETPIAFNPEKELFEYAVENAWQVIVERKNMIYKLQGENGSYQLASSD